MSARLEDLIRTLLRRKGAITNRQVVDRARVSRQAVHRALAAMVTRGELAIEGAGRSVRYRFARPAPITIRRATAGLAEDAVWSELAPRLGDLPPATRGILQYAFTEMLNNAIEHSGSPTVDLDLSAAGDRVGFDVVDEGVGLFEKVRRGFELASPLEAVAELTKGKVTTDPSRHTGEGIFFVSRVADRFEAESGTVRWIVDGVRDDMTVATVPERRGTRIRFEIARDTAKDLASLFERYTTDLAFDRTRFRVKLFELGTEFVSRSEARRLLRGLERFREVVLDFDRVELVGQGFADEVFRVWAGQHPETRLAPERMAPAVAFMVERARSGDT